VANHGAEALNFLTNTHFWHSKFRDGLPLTLVLMDIEMPVMDGLTCARRIREMQREGKIIKHVPILAVSANARSEQVKRSMEAGMDDAIAKPFRIVELLPKIIKLAIIGTEEPKEAWLEDDR
jgi:CheY-like chemotaxis protein